jgi:hypothetical protein
LDDGPVTIPQLLKATGDQFGFKVAAVDIFLASRKVALAFTSSTEALPAASAGLKIGDQVFELSHRALGNHGQRLRKFTVSNTDCTDTQLTTRAILEAFSPYGKIVTVAPRRWRDSIYPTGAWHVNILATGDEAPPALVDILGVPAYVDIPGVRRICRHCKTEKHTKLNCRIGKMAQREQAIARKFTLAPTPSDVSLASVSPPLLHWLISRIQPNLRRWLLLLHRLIHIWWCLTLS